MRPKFFFSLYILCLLLFLTNCSTSYKISNQNLSALYDRGENFIHPRFTVFHSGNDISKLFMELPSEDLLYKKNESGKSIANVRLTYLLFSDYDSKQVIDSGSAIYNYEEPDNKAMSFISNLEFKTAVLRNFVLRTDVRDENRNQTVTSFINIEKTNRQSAQWFMLTSPGTTIPMFQNYVGENESFSIYTSDTVSRKMFVRCYFRDFPLAVPPFSDDAPLKFNYAADSIFTLMVPPSGEIRLPKKGFYHFQYDTAVKAGLTVFMWDEDFPKITDAVQLIESLRYLTTRKEYDELSASADKKTAVDKYWLDLSGNQERGKVLIRKYYSRVQSANIFFTSYLEGWKTDRGLVYTIFGSPTSVFKSAEAEDWTYGNFNTINSITFTFVKIYNPFSDNDYVLRRSKAYEDSWYRAVDRWREGVVVND